MIGQLTRREFLNTSAAAAGTLVSPGAFAEKPSGMLIIDSHAHIYGEDEQRYPTIEKPYRPPPGKGTVAHLRQEIQEPA